MALYRGAIGLSLTYDNIVCVLLYPLITFYLFRTLCHHLDLCLDQKNTEHLICRHMAVMMGTWTGKETGTENGSESGNVIEIERGKTETGSAKGRGKEIVTETGKERDM